jgi:uncharacterized protein YlxW (UPF0749 family)
MTAFLVATLKFLTGNLWRTAAIVLAVALGFGALKHSIAMGLANLKVSRAEAEVTTARADLAAAVRANEDLQHDLDAQNDAVEAWAAEAERRAAAAREAQARARGLEAALENETARMRAIIAKAPDVCTGFFTALDDYIAGRLK